MPLKTPRAILFDLDGTLADTAPDLAGAVNRMQVLRALEPTPYALLRPVASAGARGLLGVGFDIGPTDENFIALRDEFFDTYAAGLMIESRLFDGVPALLAALTERGIVWGIVTNKSARFSEPLVQQIGLHQTGCLVSGDTTAFTKPHAEPLLEAARRIAIAPEDCWYVGDDLRDIQSGRAAGMPTVAAAWGYCGNTEAASWGAHAEAATPLDLLKLLESPAAR